jgi:BirA family transcriptional regulator, biotin operon repressor / biotin---[acetyl-CoA-carboxylase] ligase
MTTAIRVYEQLGSTQTEALNVLREGKTGPGWIQALSQTQGVGRRGRKWESVRGNLMASWFGVLTVDQALVPQMAFVAALSVTDLLRPYVRDADRLKIKWPNDVLYGGHKLCGILVESVSVQDPGKVGVVVGIGININGAPKLNAAYKATSVRESLSMDTPALLGLDPVEWLRPLSETFENRLEQWMSEGFTPLAADWLEIAHGIGARVSFTEGEGTYEGIVEGLSADGRLNVRDDAGRLRQLTNADIAYLEAAPCS